MESNNLKKMYFNWMYGLVCNRLYSEKTKFIKLFTCLHSIEFTYSIELDDNRACDGIDLRQRFGYEYHLDPDVVANVLGVDRCTVLEMLIALALRCEEHIMSEPNKGDRTSKWFWIMIENLGLDESDDDNFDEVYVRQAIDIFLNRKYKPNGDGGLFTIDNCKFDLRTVEIWYQLNWYLTKLIEEAEENERYA